MTCLARDSEAASSLFDRRRPLTLATPRPELDTLTVVRTCKGILADRLRHRSDADYLAMWLGLNAELADDYPYNLIYRRLCTALIDGVRDMDEERDLLDVLHRVTGNTRLTADTLSEDEHLPVTQPAPAVAFHDGEFVFTGVFRYGDRVALTAAVERRGGTVRDHVGAATDYVVVGAIGADSWSRSTSRGKLEAALQWRALERPIAVISEAHWAAAL